MYSVENKNNIISINEELENQMVVIQYDNNSVYPELSYQKIPEIKFSNDLPNSISNLSIYDCIQGECSKTNGYFYYGKEKNISVVKCDKNKCEITNNSNICNKDNYDIAYYDTSFKFCYKNYQSNYIYKSKEIISNQNNFILTLNDNYSYNNSYKIYIIYKNSHIIGLSHLGKKKKILK